MRFRNALGRLLTLMGIAAGLSVPSGCGPHALEVPAVVLSTAGGKPSPDNLLGADDWPAWRGGPRHGVGGEMSLPVSWDFGSNILWSVNTPGEGHSSPIVVGDRVFLTAELEQDQESALALLCFDAGDGQLLWSKLAGRPRGATHRKNGHASPTPASDGRHVIVHFGGVGLSCYDLHGRRVWHTPVEQRAHKWGAASSPTLADDLVVQLLDGESESFLLALDKRTGQEAWRTPRASRGCWTTPVFLPPADGGAGILVVNGTGSEDGSPGRVIAYDAASGEPRWELPGVSDIPCPTTIVGDGLLVSSSGGNGPVFAMQPGADSARILWRRPSGGPYVPTGVIYQGRLYLVTDGGVATCHDLADGTVVWRERLSGAFSASLVAGDGKIYATSEQGDVYVLAAGDRFELLATNRMRERCLATPALAKGRLFLRTERQLVCVGGGRAASRLADVDEAPRLELFDERAQASISSEMEPSLQD